MEYVIDIYLINNIKIHGFQLHIVNTKAKIYPEFMNEYRLYDFDNLARD